MTSYVYEIRPKIRGPFDVNVGPEKILIARIEPRGCPSETGDKNYKQWQRSCTCIRTGFARSWKQCCMVPSFICYLKKHFTFTVRFFETNKDEEACRDILLHPETGLNVVIVTHPVTLERFVVPNNPSCSLNIIRLLRVVISPSVTVERRKRLEAIG